MEPTRNTFMKTITVREKQITVPRAPDGKDFLKEWLKENEEEVESLRKLEESQRANTNNS
jgi:large subunit ribosomal protein L41